MHKGKGVEHHTVLVVDDDPGVTQTFARMLQLGGYDVLTAADAETGLREVEAAHPDAILLDLRLPFEDGLTFLRRLRAREDTYHTPVAILTGDYFVDETVSRELTALEASVYYKPLWFEDLLGITRQLLQNTH